MEKRTKKFLSAVLTMAMVLSLLPVQALAEEDPKGESVLLPVTDGALMMPTNAIGVDATPVYASKDAYSVYLSRMELGSPVNVNSDNARIQALDANSSAVGQTATFTLYSSMDEVGSRELYFFDRLTAGDYPLVLTYGDVTTADRLDLPYVLRVVDAPVIVSGYLSGLSTAGATLSLSISGYAGDPNHYSFQLVDMETNQEIECSAEHRRTAENGYGAATLTYALTPQNTITVGTQYALKITAASGELYSNAASISSTASEPEENELAVLGVEADPSVTGGLTVTVAGAEPGKEYQVTAVMGNSSQGESVLYDQTQTAPAEAGQWTIPIVLEKNGLVLPLSVYGSENIDITVSGPNGSDSDYYRGENSYLNQYTNMTLTRTGGGTYSFTLTGCNMLLDIYEKTTPTFSLKYYDSTQRKYIDITDVQATGKRDYLQGDSFYVEFSGNFTVSPELTAGRNYTLFYDNESLASTSSITGAEAEELRLRSLNLAPYDDQTKSFALNFGQLRVETSLSGAMGKTASIVLYDLTANAVAAQAEAAGTLDEEGRLDFSVGLEPTPPLDSTHTYQIRITCGGETVTSADYGTTYEGLSYDDTVTPPTYFYVEEPVFAGDTTLTFQLSSYDMKNVDTAYLADHPIVVTNRATETAVAYTELTPEYRDRDWYVTLTLKNPLVFGTYDYNEYSSFEALPADGVVLGTAEGDDAARTVTIANCRNLPEGNYTGILYNTYEGGYGKLADLTVSRQSDTELLVSGFPGNLPDGSYTLEIQCGNVYLGTASAYLTWNDGELSQDPTIRVYDRVFDGQYYRYEEIVYQTASDTVALGTYLPGYAYVRYSEDADFAGVDYRPIREYYDQTLELSQGTGEKTIYIQFRKTNGEESPVYQWKCQRVDALDQQTIVSAAVLVDGTATPLVPEDSAFALELVSTSRLVSVTAEFLEADGSADYRNYLLAYVEETEGGYYRFQCQLDSGDYDFRYSDYRGVRFQLTDITGDTVYDESELQIRFGNGIILDAWANDDELYTAETNFDVAGYAPGYAEISANWNTDENKQTQNVTADEDGRFTFDLSNLPETASRNEAKLTVTADVQGKTYTETVYLYVDRTAPVLTELKATLTNEGNAVLTWNCEEANLAYYLLWRDDAPVWTAEGERTSTSYTAANGADARFRVVAVDKAGNQSEPMEVTPGDTEAPTAPGVPTMTAHGTQSLSFQWAAATDNVAVYAYEIWRNGEQIAEVGQDTLSYQDTGLTEGTAYTYALYARDRASNKSGAAEASLSTAALTITESTTFAEQYVKEEHPDGVEAEVRADQTDDLYDLDGVQAVLCYKAADAEEWSELELETSTGRYGCWTGDWMIEELEPGTYTVCFRLTDPEGTVKETEPRTVQIVQDTTPPEVSITDPKADETLGGGKVQEVSFTATDNVGVERVELSYSTDGETFTAFAEIKAEVENQKTLHGTAQFPEAAALPSGEVTLRATAYDRRQNQGVSQDVTFTLDNTAPEVPGDFFVGGNSEKITVMWSYPALTTQSDFQEFRVYRAASGSEVFTCVEELSTIGYYDTTETGIVANTTYDYYVTAVDKYGNESDGTEVRSGQLTSDTQEPVIHSILPADGAPLQKSAEFSVSATDNYMLGTCEIAYQVTGAAEWTELTSLTPEATTRDHVYHFTWDLSGVEAGTYTVRFTVRDGSGLLAETTRSYTVRSYSAPQAPVLTAEADGHKAVRLSWTYGGDPESLRSFALYRGTGTDGELTYLCGLSADTREYLDQVRFDGDSQAYRYQIVALDQFGAQAESGIVSVTAVSNDSESPVAVIGPENLAYAAVGTPVALTGAASTDNDAVASYAWNFGDGESATGATTQHTYTTAGTYIVTLTVTDAYGNEDTDTVELTVVDPSAEDVEYTLLNLTICDAITEDPVENAEITLDGGAETIQVWTDADGTASCVVPNGSYSVGTYADGYLVRTVTLEAAGGTAEHTIGLTNGSIMSGSLTATEMTYDEIVAAGIDPNAPGNQHVYKFAVELTFTVGLQSYQLPYTVYKNAQGQILSGGGSGGGFFALGGGISGGFDGINIGLFPITENFVLVIYGEARWLKEMYNVELVVMNHSATDTLDQVSAELELPEGLSLADMVDGAQSAVQELGNVGHNETASARWYVRGDQEGEYNLTAKVQAVSMPYGEVIQQTFTTQEPLKVYAGSALRLTVTANDFTERGEQYPVTLRLENVSDKSIYNLSFGVTGVEQFKVLRMGNQTAELPIDGEDFEDQFIRTVPELAPGGYMEIEISSTIWFNSIAEVGEAALKTYLNTKGLGALGSFVNVGYYLQDISVVALEGSTTTIPYTIQVKQTERPNFLLSVYEAAKDLYEGEEPPSTLMDMLVEVFGSELPIWAQEGTKVILSLPQGTTDYDVRITLADGTQDGQTLRNEYASITSGTGLEMFFEDMNTITIQSGENGSFAINGLKAGDTEINISVSDKDGFQVDYKIPLHINGEQVDVNFDLGMDPDTGEFSVDSDMIGQIVESLQGEEKATFEENPFLWFASHLELNLEASEEGLENVLSLDEDTLSDLLSETALSYLDVNGGVASLSLDRGTLQQVENAKSDTEAVRIILRELGADAAEEMFGVDRPTYEFLIQVGEDAGKTVSQFGDGQVQVEIPYELQPGESAEDIVIQRVEEDGSYELVPSEYDSAAGLVSFTTDQFSYYRIGLSGQQTPDPEEPDPETPGDSGNQGGSNRPSGGGQTSSGSVQTEVTDNQDGSVTTTVTNSVTGTVTQTTQYPDGSELVVKTERDGTTTTTRTDKDGGEIVIVQRPDGETTTTERRSDGVVVNTHTEDGHTTAQVTIPSRLDDGAEISVPVNLGENRGTVSVRAVYRNGSEEVLEGNYADGLIQVYLAQSATLEVLDDFVPAASFVDVSEGAYYYDAVAWAVKNGITTGVMETIFAPNRSCTRAQVLTFLWRAAGSPQPSGSENPFTDVQEGSYYYDAVLWAVENGITTGVTETAFAPDATVTRGQAVTFQYRAAGSPAVNGGNAFADVAEDAYCHDAVNWAVEQGITLGTTVNTFSPGQPCLRGQIVTFLYRDLADA